MVFSGFEDREKRLLQTLHCIAAKELRKEAGLYGKVCDLFI